MKYHRPWGEGKKRSLVVSVVRGYHSDMYSHESFTENTVVCSDLSKKVSHGIGKVVILCSVLLGGCSQADQANVDGTKASTGEKRDLSDKPKESLSRVTVEIPLNDDLKEILKKPSIRMEITGLGISPVYRGVRVFINQPEANNQTSLQDPHYVASIAVFPSTDEPQGYILDATKTIRTLKEQNGLGGKKLDVTFVGILETTTDKNQGVISVKGVEFK